MKKIFVKALCFILLLAMLAPLVIACKDEPPNGDGSGSGSGEGDGSGSGSGEGNGEGSGGGNEMNNFFKLKVTNQEKFKIFDLEDEDFVNANGIKTKVKNKDGLTALEWEQNVAFNYPIETTNIDYVTSIKFSVYSDKATGAKVTLKLSNAPTQATQEVHGGNVFAVQETFFIDFTGWKTFDFTTGAVSGFQARNHDIVKVGFFSSGYANGTMPSETLYITSIEMTRDTYEVVAPEGVDVNDPALYKKITANYREILIGNEAVSDTPAYASLQRSIESACQTHLNHYKSTWQGIDKKDTLFGITVEKKHFSGEQNTQTFYGKILPLAKGYAMPGQKFYKDPEVLEAIKNCLEYGYKHYYGPSLLEYGAFGNWWEWEIGIPLNLLPTLVLIEDEITPADCEKYLTVHKALVPYPLSKAGNKIWHARNCIISAALRRSAFDLCVTTEYMNDLFNYIESYAEEGGFFKDNSFVQHTSFAYTMGYGGTYMGDLPQILYYLNGTPFFPQQENVKNHYTWVLEAFRPAIYKNRTMSALAGRNVGRVIGEDARSYASNSILIHYYAPADIKAQLEPMIAAFMQLYNNSFSGNVPLCLTNYANELYARLKDTDVEPYLATKVFGMMARVIHHGPKYGVCLSMSNQEIAKYESINDENKVAWYHGDGMIQIYVGDYSFDTNFYSFINPYFMPGVTASTTPRTVSTGAGKYNASPYAGGIASDRYGSAGYILSYHELNGTPWTTLSAKKSYFFFDNEIICVGSDISDKSGTNVVTTVENRYLTSGTALSIGGQTVSAPKTSHTTIKERTMHLSNMGGYVLLRDDGATLSYAKVTNLYNNTNGYNGANLPAAQTGKREFLEILLNHGAGDKTTGKIANSSYFYAYLPGSTVEETESYASAPDVELIRRTSNAHAVLEKKLGIVAANFFNESSGEKVSVPDKLADCTAVKYITADTPACVMVTKGENGEYTVYVSDPTNTYRNTVVEIEIEGVTRVVSGDSNVNATVSGGIVSLVVNTENSLRATYSVTVC